MSPVCVGNSRFTSALERGEAKLWILLVGVNQYQDKSLPSLRYSAIDCQGVGEALSEATQAFPCKEVMIYHDLAHATATLANVQSSLRQITAAAKAQDTVLFYFSGHGLLEPNSQQTVLCLADTYKEKLLETGLKLQDLLTMLNQCAAIRQVIWLDACHSGNMTLVGARGKVKDETFLNPTSQVLELLRHRAAKSKGFYALLSCDQGQQSWEFPDLGHGVFSYYLMRGLRGEAADSQGVIEADGLYRYVYHQTLQYIDKANQQLRLVNQQKRSRGETDLHPEYTLQTPKRIVEGVGELVLGLQQETNCAKSQRRALMIEGLATNETSTALSEILRQEGDFELQFWPADQKASSEVRETIQRFLRTDKSASALANIDSELNPASASAFQEVPTLLLYLRGRIEECDEGEPCLVLNHQIRINRSWLRQELRRAKTAQQIVILDCPGARSLEDWVEELKFGSEHGQCLIAAATPAEDPELFAQVLLESLVAANSHTGLSVAGWLAKLQTNLEGLGVNFHVWLSGTQGVIEVLPEKITCSFENVLPVKIAANLKNTQPLKQPTLESPTVATPYPAKLQLAPIQYSNLEQLLTQFIGPISTTLLEQVIAEADNSQILLAELSLHLSPHQRPQFEKLFTSILQATISPATQTTSTGAKTADTFTEINPKEVKAMATDSSLSAREYDILEAILVEYIGPIAPALLQETLTQVPNSSDLVKDLSLHLSPLQKTEFEKRASTVLDKNNNRFLTKSDIKPQTRSASIAIPQTQVISSPSVQQSIDEEYVCKCEQTLTKLIGPIARLIIANLNTNPQITKTEFIEKLVAEIPDSNKAKQFRQLVTE